MELVELIELYPLLYHMAERGSWPSIQAHGLRSTSALLDLFEITRSGRAQYESELRTESMKISHEAFGEAVLRDNKPMTESGLARALQNGMTAKEWLKLLNGKVFFWPTANRLTTFLNASSYRENEHEVITVRTSDLMSKYSGNAWLSPMNSGATKPFPHPRGRGTFNRIDDHPFAERKRRGLDPLAEVAIDGMVDDVATLAESVTVWKGDDELETIWTSS